MNLHVTVARDYGEGRSLAFTLRTASPRAPAKRSRALRSSSLLTLACLLACQGYVQAGGDAVAFLVLTTADGQVLVDVPLPADNTWRLEWTHSVAQVQVVDAFAWREGVMYVTDQYTPYLDIAGLGNFAGRGELRELPGGGYHLANIDFPLHGNVHSLIIGSSRAPSVLMVGDRRFALSETHPAAHARFEVHVR